MTNDLPPQEQNDSIDDARQLVVAVQQLVESNAQEQETKRAELEVRRCEVESNERVALASIEAQKGFHTERFTRYNSHLIHRYVFICFITGAFLTFSSVAIWLGAKDIVLDLVKILLPLAVGLLGGYHWGGNAQSRREQEGSSEESG